MKCSVFVSREDNLNRYLFEFFVEIHTAGFVSTVFCKNFTVDFVSLHFNTYSLNVDERYKNDSIGLLSTPLGNAYDSIMIRFRIVLFHVRRANGSVSCMFKGCTYINSERHVPPRWAPSKKPLTLYENALRFGRALI